MRRYGRFVPTSTITRRMDAKDDRVNRATHARAAKAAALKVAADLLKPIPVNPDADRLMELEPDPDDRDDRDDDAGARCTAACGFCGRCS